jgi:pyruvate/2-oxoacid:ferredoxin oxidoreductase beta subunit
VYLLNILVCLGLARAVRVAKEMVESGLWPLYEVVDNNLTLSYKPKELKPVKEVLRSQGRFRHITDDEVDEVQGWVNQNWARLLEKNGGPLF